MAEADYRSALNPTQAHRAARRVRRWLGAEQVDLLLGATGEAQAARALLANSPQVTTESVQDGWDLLEAQRAGVPTSAAAVWTRRAAWAGAVALGAALLGLLVTLAGGFLASRAEEAPNDWLQAIAELVGGGARIGVPLAVLCGVGATLLWVSFLLSRVARVADAREVVRWAAARPGQGQRGLPMVDPIRGLLSWFILTSLTGWGTGLVIGVFAFWYGRQGDFETWQFWLAAGALCLMGYLAAAGGRRIAGAAAVAQKHLFLLRHREDGLPMDVSTAVTEQFLLVCEQPGPGYGIEERTAYPLTTRLTVEELGAHHAYAAGRKVSMVGDLDEAPLITRQVPAGSDGMDAQWQREYGGGWLVAQARTVDLAHPAWLMVKQDPARFMEEVLPAFGERHGAAPGSVRPVPHEQLPEGGSWLRSWVRERR